MKSMKSSHRANTWGLGGTNPPIPGPTVGGTTPPMASLAVWRNKPTRGRPRRLAEQTHPRPAVPPIFAKRIMFFQMKSMSAVHRHVRTAGLAVRLRSTRWLDNELRVVDP
jgi:hypothetical protein